MSRKNQLFRSWVLPLFLGGVFVIFGLRLVYLQVYHNDTYRALADRQYSVPVKSSFDRGSIYLEDKEGNTSLAAGLATGAFVTINPKQITDAQKAYGDLNNIVKIDEKTFLDKAARKNDTYEEIIHRISDEDGKKISALKIPGVSVSQERWRSYPYKNLAAQTIGFVAYNGNDLMGRYGLERYYNDVLSRDPSSVYTNFFAEVFSDLSKNIFSNSRERDGDLVLTIEPNVERYLEDTLDEVRAKWGSDLVGGIIMDTRDGRIYGFGTSPSFDLNAFGSVENPHVYGNPLVEGIYEMGSIIKPLTMAAGIDGGAVKPTTKYNDEGFVMLSGKKVRNFDGKGRGYVDMQTILAQSLNTGSVFVAQSLGREKFQKYMRGYGWGEETGIDLPGEIPGLVKNLDSVVDVDWATTAFGQGIAMTPIATVRALSSLANGGKLVNPYIVSRIEYKGGFSKKIVPDDGVQILKPESTEAVTRMLVNVVDTALAGGGHNIPKYSVAAKTGTAQIVGPGGNYYEDRFLHSFFGYFPAYSPRFMVFLYQVYPKGARYSSETLTDPFLKITKFLLNYYEIPPDR